MMARRSRPPARLDPEFDVLYRDHAPALLRYLRRRLGAQRAEDATAEVFARALQSKDRYVDRGDTALPWLYGIATNVVADHRRSERRRLRAVERLARDAGPGRTVDADLRGVDGFDGGLVRMIRRLSSADRETLLLIAWGELTYDETAVALDIPPGTVASRMTRIRRLAAAQASSTPSSQPLEGASDVRS